MGCCSKTPACEPTLAFWSLILVDHRHSSTSASLQIQMQIIEQARADQVPESSDSLFAYLIERVRNNLHIILCLSPVGNPFR